ncbi:hypothetical protein [Conexibacter sp. SYSU D00693]|uniref:hypothetical protein n=1 Tax=Conexibacter sp. SYSU D00693 TaxID=2812560 RepID=UPI00196AE033|nr:hypothetical protein [Conexibacter sp. SYSU D00693]
MKAPTRPDEDAVPPAGALAQRAKDLEERLQPAPRRGERPEALRSSPWRGWGPVIGIAAGLAAALGVWVTTGWSGPLDEALAAKVSVVLAVAGVVTRETRAGRAVEHWILHGPMRRPDRWAEAAPGDHRDHSRDRVRPERGPL